MAEKREDAETIVKKWDSLARDYSPQALSDEEKARFDQARSADEQSERSGFVLGGKITLGI